MPENKLIHDLDEADNLAPDAILQVRGADLQRWADEKRQLQKAIADEREECISIADHYLAKLFHGHGAGGDQAITAIIHDIRARGDS